MMAGAYTLDLYCDAARYNERGKDSNPNHAHDEFPHQFVEHDRAQAFRAARRRGWLISDKRQLCPKCSGKRKANT